ncbi:hypothetical protein OH781_40955 [Streptomyces sp. NBC_01550]|uniref:AfsR/SARP family transcriptional regulator n=1 Tax=Streptomyces sp. NBC_01550 TaxID=2975875 RepID=UPI00386EF07A
MLAPLRQAAAQHPLDEGLQAGLIELLAATGQQAEALAVYRTVRARLADDLGVDPGPELCAAQESVLRRTVSRSVPSHRADAAVSDNETGTPGPASQDRRPSSP